METTATDDEPKSRRTSTAPPKYGKHLTVAVSATLYAKIDALAAEPGITIREPDDLERTLVPPKIRTVDDVPRVFVR